MQSGFAEVIAKAVLFQVGVHQRNSSRFVVKGADMHDLHAQTLFNGQKLAEEQSSFFFLVAVSTAQSKSCLVTKSGKRITEIQLNVDLSA